MVKKRLMALVTGSLACGLVGSALANDEIAQLRQELASMRAELAEVKAQRGASWMDQAREAELRAMVEEIVADASTRTAFREGGLGAGHDGKNFFLEGEGFRMNLSGQIQFRSVHNSDGGASGNAGDADGFELRRTKVQFNGHLGDPKIDYLIRIAHSRSSGDTSLEEAAVGYLFDNGIKLKAGKMKLPFLRQELLSSTRQLAVDRGLSTEYFTMNFAEQVQAFVPISDRLSATLAYSDGGNTESSAALADTVKYAFTGRVDAALVGDVADGSDLRPRKDEGHALLLGLALHAQEDEVTDAETLAWTVDALGKAGPLTGMAAYMGGRDDGSDVQTHGLLAEAGYAVTQAWQPFVRYDGLWQESAGEMQALTAGTNYYLAGHGAKFTADVVWLFAGDALAGIAGLNSAPTNSGIGLVTGQQEQVALRAQFQLLF